MAAKPRALDAEWPSLVPIAATGVFAASTVSIYLRDVAAQASCSGTLVCGDFRADPRSLAAGLTFGALALVLLVGTVVALAAPRTPGTWGRWMAPLLALVVASSSAALVAVITLNNVGAGVFQVLPVAIWAFLGIGFVALWVVTTFGATLVGVWRWPARGLAAFNGAVAIVATLVTLMTALGPGRMFL